MTNQNKLILFASLGALLVCLLVYGLSAISYKNQEVDLRTQITAAQRDLANQLDVTLKSISGSAQVAQFQMKSIKDIIVAPRLS